MSESSSTTRSSDSALQALAVASHEVRGALAAIIGHAQLLGEPQVDPDRVRSSVRIIEETGRDLLDRFDRILRSAESEHSNPSTDPRPADLRALLESCGCLYRASAEQRGLELECVVDPELPAQLVFDSQVVHQVLDNLLSNALKFTVQGSIRLVLHHPRPDRVRIEVSDTGRGIEPKAHHDIFNRFQRGATTDAGIPGIGLGLSLCRALMESMRGSITLRSIPGIGSTFAVEFPVERIPEPGTRQLQGLRILLVDDCRDTLELLEHLLRAGGAEVCSAPDGCAALMQLGPDASSDAFDLIILDVLVLSLSS